MTSSTLSKKYVPKFSFAVGVPSSGRIEKKVVGDGTEAPDFCARRLTTTVGGFPPPGNSSTGTKWSRDYT